ncbi:MULTISPECIES: DUF4232 domain-containing protein [Streptomyces]|uniref:DUF4232 domain-containing protein n=1 Tax=Streptomyces spororaveus TaxID=284039 RepID=A0ABQ3TL94_9ACTN|nr:MULTISPECIES: DUF4232 domain-containing protein [Streptomyces]MCX5307074.1 DUF4232 domain-containing protein [Streptomyces sp. NBC_00160]GHI81171.1 hypothetical protein Sspor_67320 [Streptomyces spororaveus]
MRVTRKAAALGAATALLAGGTLVGGPAVAAPAAACTGDQLSDTGGAVRTDSTHVRFTVVNNGPACTLRGFPTVALAGQGSPDSNKPLRVLPRGEARPVVLARFGTASTLLTFTPVLGEADGYCASGADPTVAPSLVVGVARTGFQVAPTDGGQFALCGDTVRATAFRSP